MERFKVQGIEVELIKSFRDAVLVQIIETKEIFLAPYWAIDVKDEQAYNIDDSNIISMEGWKQWQERKKLMQLSKALHNPRQKLAKLIMLK